MDRSSRRATAATASARHGNWMPYRLRNLLRPGRGTRGPMRDWEWAWLGAVLVVLLVFALMQAM